MNGNADVFKTNDNDNKKKTMLFAAMLYQSNIKKL